MASPWSPTRAAGRILIPIYRPRLQFTANAGQPPDLVVAGWQARLPRAAEPHERKYLFPDGIEKSKVLYGLYRACQATGPIFVCEGPTDAWRVGPGAVATFGNHASREQKLLLLHHAKNRPIVVLPDDDALASAQALVTELLAARALDAGDRRVVLVVPPAGRHDPGECSREEILAAASHALGNRRRVYWDAIFARAIETRYGLSPPPYFDDVKIAATLLRETFVHEHLWGPISAQDRCQPYCLQTTGKVRILRILDLLANLPARLSREGLDYTYCCIELPVVVPTMSMILHGVGVDTQVLEQIRQSYSVRLDILRHQINETAGENLNPENSLQVRHFLYVKCRLQLPGFELTENPPADDAALKQIQGLHPVIPLLRAYRSGRPVLTMAESLLRNVSRTTGHVHATLDPLGAATGRFSCREPNLQGLPHPVLAGLRARDGHELIELDISQTELRVLAHFTQEPSFVQAYLGDVDIHRRTAALALGIPEDQDTEAQRQEVGKPVNFGIIYGETKFGLSSQLGVSQDQAQSFIDGYFRGYPLVRQWIDNVKEQARRQHWVLTLYGRRRQLAQFWPTCGAEQEKLCRQAVNTVIQGTAADIIKMALARLYGCMQPDWRILLTVHDSVIVEVPDRAVNQAAEHLRAEMEKPPPCFFIPLKVTAKHGRTWAQCKGGHCAVDSTATIEVNVPCNSFAST